MTAISAPLHSAVSALRSAARSSLKRAKDHLSESEESEPSTAIMPPAWNDRRVTLATMEELTTRAVVALDPDRRSAELPNPLISAEKFGHHLRVATSTQAEIRSVVGASSRVMALHPMADRQASLDEALIHCLHQLDHRSQAQDQRIIELESLLADASRRIVALESGVALAR